MSERKLYFVVNGLNYQKNLAAQLLIGWMQRLVEQSRYRGEVVLTGLKD